MAAAPSLRVRKGASAGKRSGAYVGYVGYAKILACLLAHGPMTHLKIAEVTGIYHAKLRGMLKQFRALKLIHRIGWEKPKHGFDIAIWQLDEGDDVPAPLNNFGRPQAYQDHRPALIPRIVAFASLIDALRLEPSTRSQLEHQSGIAHGSLSRALDYMRKAHLITIASYSRRSDGSGPWIPHYVWNPGGANVTKPQPKTSAERDNRKTARVLTLNGWDRTIVGLKRSAGFQAARV